MSYCDNMKMGDATDIGVHNKLFENNSFQQAKTMSNTDTAHKKKVALCLYMAVHMSPVVLLPCLWENSSFISPCTAGGTELQGNKESRLTWNRRWWVASSYQSTDVAHLACKNPDWDITTLMKHI